MSFMDKDWEPGREWTHRIDAVPCLGKMVKVRFDDRLMPHREAEAIVLPSSTLEREQFNGIGGEVVYLSRGYRYLSNVISEWRYK